MRRDEKLTIGVSVIAFACVGLVVAGFWLIDWRLGIASLGACLLYLGK